MLTFKTHQFEQLSLIALYNMLQLRADVFVVGQQCVYLDPDGKDIAATHLFGKDGDQLVAYARIFPPGSIKNDEIIFGRVAVSPLVRGKGYGKRLMEELVIYCEKHFPGVPIKCSAQHYLKRFYEEFGFAAFGDVYLEESIPHIKMIRVTTEAAAC